MYVYLSYRGRGRIDVLLLQWGWGAEMRMRGRNVSMLLLGRKSPGKKTIFIQFLKLMNVAIWKSWFTSEVRLRRKGSFCHNSVERCGCGSSFTTIKQIIKCWLRPWIFTESASYTYFLLKTLVKLFFLNFWTNLVAALKESAMRRVVLRVYTCGRGVESMQRLHTSHVEGE